jgi:hypothetical protein
MKISVKLVALHFQLSILTGKFKLQNHVSFLYQFINENGFYTRARHFYWYGVLSVGSIPRSTDDTLHQFKQMFPEIVGTVVDQNKIGQSVTLDSFTIQRFV